MNVLRREYKVVRGKNAALQLKTQGEFLYGFPIPLFCRNRGSAGYAGKK